MPGTWDHGKVRDWRKLHNVGDDAFPKGSPEDIEGDWQFCITQALAMRMSTIGIWKITEDNVDKVFARSHIVDKLHGTSLYLWDEEKQEHGDYCLRLADIERRIGMTASAETLTDAAFKRKIADELLKQAEKELRRQKAKVAA